MSHLREIVDLILRDSELVTITYETEFIVCFQHPYERRSMRLEEMFAPTRVPSAFNLRLGLDMGLERDTIPIPAFET